MKFSVRLLFSGLFFLTNPSMAQQWSATSSEVALTVNLDQGTLDTQLALPDLPSTDGFAPQMSLAWLSTGTDPGEGFGPGWGLQTSSIVATLDQGGVIHASSDRLGKLSKDFKYSLEWDGQRLAWLDVNISTRVSRYKVEHSDNEVTIVRYDLPFTEKLYAGTAHEREVKIPAGFRVIQPNGVVRVYSGDLQVAEGLVINADAKNEFSRTFISRWPLVYEIKPGGNTIEYQYQKVGASSVLSKIIFAYERSSYVFHWQEREHGPVSHSMGYPQERLHLYTRLVACYDQQPQHTWVFGYQNGPATSFEESSCADPSPQKIKLTTDDSSLWSRFTDTLVGWFRSITSVEGPEILAMQPRLSHVHRFGSKVGDLETLKNERRPTLSFAYTQPAAGPVHVQTLARDGGFSGFGPSGNLEFLDADQDGFLDLMQSSASGSQSIAGRAGSLDPGDRKNFLVQNPSRSLGIGFNEDSFRQGSVITADMDGDGWADIVHIKPDGNLLIYRNDRQGSYVSDGTGILLEKDDGSLGNLQVNPELIGYGRGAIMDIDGDRRADIIHLGLDGSGQVEWQIYLNKSAADSTDGFVFKKRKFYFPFRTLNTDILQRNDLRFVDANHDGLVDLVKFSQNADGNSRICIFENLGGSAGAETYLFAGDKDAEEKGCAGQLSQTLPDSGNIANRINSVWLADINGDGLIDVVDLNDDGHTFSFWLGQIGHAPYATRQELTLAESETLAIDPQSKYNSFPLDIDLDGVDEIVFFEPSTATLKILRFPAVTSGTEAGLLAHIHEEQGVDHWIQYQPAYRFGFKTGASLPGPSFPVRQIVSRDSVIEPASYQAAVMNYQDPQWDADLGSLLGFKRAQVFEPGTHLAEGRAVEDARIEDYVFAIDEKDPAKTRALAGRWSEKSIINGPWTAADETRFVEEAQKAESGQTISVKWNVPDQARLWREMQKWSVKEFAANGLPEGTAHLRPRYEISLDGVQIQRCEDQGLLCANPQVEQTLYQWDKKQRLTQSIFTRRAYQVPLDSATPDTLPGQSLTQTWSYNDSPTNDTSSLSILRVLSYQEFDDAKGSHLAYQEDFEYLGENNFDQPDTHTQTLYRRLDQPASADLPPSVRTRRFLNYDAFGNSSSIQDESGQELFSALYDSGSGSLLLESHDAGRPLMRFCFSQRDCTIPVIPEGIALPTQSMVVSLQMDSAGAWEYRRADALQRPIQSLTSSGLKQTQSYQLNHRWVAETVSDQGQRRSTQTLLNDGAQRIRLAAQTGPAVGQLRVGAWDQLSRRGSLLLSSEPYLVDTQDAQESVLQKEQAIIPASTSFSHYDALGRLTRSSLDQEQKILSIRYFPWGQVESSRNEGDQPVNQTLVTRLDDAPVLIIDPTGAKQSFTKDVWGSIESVRLADETQPRRFLSYGGRLPAESFVPGLRRISYIYDDRLLIKDRYTRDAKDQIASTSHYSYDSQYRLLQIRNAQNQLVSSYTYANDSLATATQNDPAQSLQVRRIYTRDEQGQVKSEQILYQNSQRQLVHQATETYEYTEDGLLKRRTNAAAFAIDYRYAPDQSIDRVHFKGPDRDQILFQATAHDTSGLLQGAAYADRNLNGRWDHDAITGLTTRSQICQGSAANCVTTIDEQRKFAGNGQLLERTRSFADLAEKAAFGYSDRRELVKAESSGFSENFAYNGSGVRQKPLGHVYDSLGRLQKSSTIDAIVYSDSDRPLSVTKESQTWLLGYDSQGTLVYRRNQADQDDLATLFLDFEDVAQKGSDLRLTLALPGTVQAVIDSKRIDYQWLDAEGSPIATLDAAGAIIESFSRKAFGQRLEPVASDNFLPMDFARQRLDADTGLIVFQDRWYDPESGLFISPDSRAIEAPELCLQAQWMDCNLYSYRGNNPL